jgi:hypothetical protein
MRLGPALIRTHLKRKSPGEAKGAPLDFEDSD